jgi:hypothetical protein
VKELAHTPLGRIAVEPKALERLVEEAAAGAGGVHVDRVSVSLEEGVDIVLSAPRRAVLPELGALVQRHVAAALEQALDARPARVDVTIEAILPEGDR